MANRPSGLPHAVIFDVDGTLVDVSGVRHYVLADPRRKDFESFHAAASFCPPVAGVVELAVALERAGFVVLVVTARMERWRYRTSTWLRKWEVPLTHLYMRRDGDARRDVAVKRDILREIRARYDVVLAVDDNPAVLALWREEGISAVVVPGWLEERQVVSEVDTRQTAHADFDPSKH